MKSTAKSNHLDQIKQAANFITQKLKTKKIPCPTVGMVLGSGFKSYLDHAEVILKIPVSEIPFFLVPRVEGHGQELTIIEYKHKKKSIFAYVLTGRVHLYENYSPHEVCFAVRCLAFAGVNRFIFTNASGALNDDIHAGDIVLIEDQINMTGYNSLIGTPTRSIHGDFLDCSNLYDKEWRKAFRKETKLPQGTYMGVLGPSFETPAEAKMFAKLGGDFIGMSTVLETIAAHSLGAKILGLAFITNTSGLAPDEKSKELDHKDVLNMVKSNSKKVSHLINVGLEVIS